MKIYFCLCAAGVDQGGRGDEDNGPQAHCALDWWVTGFCCRYSVSKWRQNQIFTGLLCLASTQLMCLLPSEPSRPQRWLLAQPLCRQKSMSGIGEETDAEKLSCTGVTKTMCWRTSAQHFGTKFSFCLNNFNIVFVVFLWSESICRSVEKTRKEGLSVNGGIFLNELLQSVSWTFFHHNFNLLFVFQCANLCVMLHECMNVCWLRQKVIFYLVQKDC